VNTAPLALLFFFLILLILISGFFSGSETGLMSLNRYRLKYLVSKGHPGAIRASRLLQKMDRLIGLILLGNNLVNILASSLATIIAIRLYGEAGIFPAAILLTLVVLIFAEVTPKTLAALYPEKISFLAVWPLTLLLKLLAPLVALVSTLANTVLRVLGIRADKDLTDSLTREELRTLFSETNALIPSRHQTMLINILDLEKVTVEDIMIPRNEIIGIDLEDDWSEIIQQLIVSQYTRLPVFRNDIDQIAGFLHMRKIMNKLARGEFQRQDLESAIREPYFIPAGTALTTQLLNFQRRNRRIGVVVNEYGDIQGLVTLEDILEEIVGEFTTDPLSLEQEIQPQSDGSYLLDGFVTIRELNRQLGWNLPVDGPKTLNGLILEYLEQIPEPQTSLLLYQHPVEILQIKSNAIKMVRMQNAITS
jgi:Mg2+/Co2+ transporter CorB